MNDVKSCKLTQWNVIICYNNEDKKYQFIFYQIYLRPPQYVAGMLCVFSVSELSLINAHAHKQKLKQLFQHCL